MDNPASDGSSAELLERHRRAARRALLLGRRQPLLLPALRGLGRQDAQRRLLQLADLQRRRRVTGIGHDAAAKIWYRALTVYMTSNTNYPGARTATLNAARDLYGAGSTQYNAVAAAWSAVNVA